MTGLEFAAVALIGVLVGRFLPSRRKGSKPVKPVCGCTHHHSYHDPQTGQCSGQVYIGHWNMSDHHEPCTCRQYSGPVPLPEVYAPEVSG